MSNIETYNLFQRINEIRKSIDYIKKEKDVSAGASSYKVVTHDQVTALVRDHMIKQGVISYPVFIEGVMNPKEVDADMKMSKQSRYEATYDFHFVNADNPLDKLVIRIQSHAMDNADKAPGKALSYAKKYAILKLFEIETGENDESTYQSVDFDFAFWVEKLNLSKDLSELKESYLAANKEATLAKDSTSLKSLTKLKDEIKAKLS